MSSRYQAVRIGVAIFALAVLVSACSSAGPSSLAAPSVPSPNESTAPPVVETSSVPEGLARVEAPTLNPYGPQGHELAWLADQAAFAVLDVHGLSGAQQQLDLSGLPNLADRVALGLEELGLAFTRSDTRDSLGEYGTIITVHDDPTATVQRWPLFDTSTHHDAAAVHRQTIEALETRSDVPHLPTTVDLIDKANWLVGRTADPSLLASELVGQPARLVAWGNREAQQYVPDAVDFTPDGISVTTTSRSTAPDVTQLPYNSGMVISRESFQWGSFSATLTLPEGQGLWPAIWLLDDEACEAPGRCLGYESSAFHEIDMIETRTQRPEELHMSVHWWDERIRTSSSTASASDDGLNITVERRPGLIIWRLGGEVVSVRTGRVESFDIGMHRSAPMNLIINTAVGGSFAGTSEIGRDGEWLGEALVPANYPTPINATFSITEIQATEY